MQTGMMMGAGMGVDPMMMHGGADGMGFGNDVKELLGGLVMLIVVFEIFHFMNEPTGKGVSVLGGIAGTIFSILGAGHGLVFVFGVVLFLLCSWSETFRDFMSAWFNPLDASGWKRVWSKAWFKRGVRKAMRTADESHVSTKESIEKTKLIDDVTEVQVEKNGELEWQKVDDVAGKNLDDPDDCKAILRDRGFSDDEIQQIATTKAENQSENDAWKAAVDKGTKARQELYKQQRSAVKKVAKLYDQVCTHGDIRLFGDGKDPIENFKAFYTEMMATTPTPTDLNLKDPTHVLARDVLGWQDGKFGPNALTKLLDGDETAKSALKAIATNQYVVRTEQQKLSPGVMQDWLERNEGKNFAEFFDEHPDVVARLADAERVRDMKFQPDATFKSKYPGASEKAVNDEDWAAFFGRGGKGEEFTRFLTNFRGIYGSIMDASERQLTRFMQSCCNVATVTKASKAIAAARTEVPADDLKVGDLANDLAKAGAELAEDVHG